MVPRQHARSHLRREHLEEVRQGLRQSRHRSRSGARRSSPTLDSRAAAHHSGDRGTEARAEHVGRRDRPGEAAGPRHRRRFRRRNRARAQQIKTARDRARRHRDAAHAGAADAAESAACVRAGRQVGRGQRRSTPARRRRATFDFEPQPHWDLGRRARHHRFRAGHQDLGRALLRAERRRGAARARADQLHARSAHARARVPRDGAAVLVNRAVADRHRQPAEVRGGPVQDRR